MTVPEFAAFMKGFASFHGIGETDVTDDEYVTVLAQEIAAGRG